MSEKLREALAHCCNVLERVPNASNSPVITIAVINGRKALAEPAPAPSDFERVFTDACDEIGCAHDNEALLEAIASLKKSAVTPQECCEPVSWQYRVLHDKGHALEREWCEWHETFKAHYEKCAAEIAAGNTRMQVRALYTLSTPPAVPRADCGG